MGALFHRKEKLFKVVHGKCGEIWYWECTSVSCLRGQFVFITQFYNTIGGIFLKYHSNTKIQFFATLGTCWLQKYWKCRPKEKMCFKTWNFSRLKKIIFQLPKENPNRHMLTKNTKRTAETHRTFHFKVMRTGRGKRKVADNCGNCG